MQAWEEKILEQEKAREEGREEGRKEGLAVGLKEGHTAGLSEGHASGLREGLTQGGIQKLQELVEKKIQKGYAAEEIAEMLEEDIETIQKLIEEI